MPTLDARLKTTTAIIASIQECKCGTRIDVSRFQPLQELTCPGCGKLFVVQAAFDETPAYRGPNGFAQPASEEMDPANRRKWIKIGATAGIVLIAAIGVGAIRKMRARDAVSPIPVLSSTTKTSPSLATDPSNAQFSISSSPVSSAQAGSIAEGVYKLKNRATGQVIDVMQRDTGANAAIKTWTSGTGFNQRWIARVKGDGFQLIALHSCKALEVQDGSTDDQAAIRQGTPTGAGPQIWKLVPAGDGFHRIVSKSSGKALTVLEVTAPTSSTIGQRAITESSAQHWKLEPLGGWPTELNAILDGKPMEAAPAPVAVEKALAMTDTRFVPVSLAAVMNCDSRTGNFSNPQAVKDTVRPLMTGRVKVSGVPFDIADAASASSGKDLLILRGGMGQAKSSYPTRVEVPVNGAPLTKLHIVGGVAGWGYPWDKNDSRRGALAVQITVARRGGTQQVLQFRNGVEFADYFARIDVPGSAYVNGFADHGRQARYFSKPLSGSEPVEKLIIESADTHIAPVFLAITGEVGR